MAEYTSITTILFSGYGTGGWKKFFHFNRVTVSCPIIFTTAYDHYALDAIKLFSIDYLLKPVTLQSLAASLKISNNITTYKNSLPDFDALAEHLNLNSKEFKHRFLIKIGSRLLFIESADVAYFYAEDKAVFLVTKEGMKYSIDYRLEKLKTMLDPNYILPAQQEDYMCGRGYQRNKDLF